MCNHGFMSSENVKSLAVEWAKFVGSKCALKRLVALDLSPSLAQKLVAGKYGPDLSYDRATLVLKEMEKDGFQMSEGKAS